MITQRSLWDRILFTYFFFCVKGTTVIMPTSKVHRKLAQSFYSHISRYNRISAEEISVGRRAFGWIYARIIQRAYRRYRKRPATLAKCAWNAIRYYDNRKELMLFSNRYFQSDEKRGLYHFQLAISAVT